MAIRNATRVPDVTPTSSSATRVSDVTPTSSSATPTSRKTIIRDDTEDGTLELGGGLRMRRDISFWYVGAIMTGIIVGSGIFVSPVSFIRHCGSVAMSLVMWVFCGLLMLGCALCYTEMGAMFPGAGGEYHFYRRVIGPLPAFLFAWISLITYYPAFYALLALATTDYLFSVFFPSCAAPEIASRMFSVWILVTVIAVNCVYVRYVTKLQAAVTVTKLLALALIIVTGCVQLARGKVEILATGFENTNRDPSAYASAIYSGLFTYGGWGFLFFLLEEIRNPEKVVPRATIMSLLLVTVLYTFTNVAYFTVLTPQDIMASPAVAMTFAEKTLGPFAAVMPIFVSLSTLGALNGAVLGGSRIFFAAARDGLFPPVFGNISTRYLTPWPSLFLACLISTIYILTGSAVTLIEYVGFMGSVVTIVTVGCLLYLRWSQPNRCRPIKVPLWVAVLTLVLYVFITVMGLYHKPMQNFVGVLLLVSGVPVYWVLVLWRDKPRALNKYHEAATVLIQKILLVLPTEKEP